jgi:hypothetical protein
MFGPSGGRRVKRLAHRINETRISDRTRIGTAIAPASHMIFPISTAVFGMARSLPPGHLTKHRSTVRQPASANQA